MTIDFHCPACSAPIHAPDSAAGKTGTCTNCQKSISIPGKPGAKRAPADVSSRSQSRSSSRTSLSGVQGSGKPASSATRPGKSATAPADFEQIDEWHYTVNGQQNGPVSRQTLEQLAASGRLEPSDLVWHSGLPTWTPASSINGLFPNAASPNVAGNSTSSHSSPQQPTTFPVLGTTSLLRRAGWGFSLASLAPRLPLILSSIAVILSAIALYFVSPLNQGLSGYDLSTPDEALLSLTEMGADQDMTAFIELVLLSSGLEKRAEEMQETLRIHNRSSYDDGKVLFVTYKANGITQYEAIAFKKDVDSGLWVPAVLDIDVPGGPVPKSNPSRFIDDIELLRAIRDWEDQSGEVERNDEQ